MGINKVVLIAALLATVPMTSFAEESFGDNQSIGVKVSTLGLGLDYSFTIAESFEGRVGFNAFKHHLSKNLNGGDFQGDIKLGTVNMLVDWFPAHDSLRLTAGLMYNKNKISLSRSGTVDDGSTNGLTVTEYAYGDYRKLAPYLGIGWTGKKKDQGLSLAVDLGVLFQGDPRSYISTDNAACIAYTKCNQKLIDDSVELNDAMKKLRYYPVASATVSYLF